MPRTYSHAKLHTPRQSVYGNPAGRSVRSNSVTLASDLDWELLMMMMDGECSNGVMGFAAPPSRHVGRVGGAQGLVREVWRLLFLGGDRGEIEECCWEGEGWIGCGRGGLGDAG